jgi:AraC-like DNA-binding protein
MNEDFTLHHCSTNNELNYVSALTTNAEPTSEYEAHTHFDEFEIYHFLEGDLFFAFEGKRIAVENNTLIIICNKTLHRPIIKNPCRYYRKRILFKAEIFSRLNIPDFELYNRLRKRKLLMLAPEVVERLEIDKMFTDIEQSLSRHTPYEDFCALVTLFSLLIKAEKNSEQLEHTDFYVYSKRVSEMINYIDMHLSEDLSYQTLSKRFYLSEKSLYKFFKKETGFTLSSYINERRIIKAQTVMNAGGSANEAATSAGFKDYSVFYRSFLREAGITPAAYIKAIRHRQ